MLKVGDNAPSFSLNDQDSKTVTLQSVKGKWVVLYFYPKDDTPGCTKEACSFTSNLPDFDGLDAVILGVSNDDEKSHQDFIKKYKLKITLLSDVLAKTSKDYDVYKLVNKDGKDMMRIVRATFIINPDGKIAKTWYTVSVDEHVEDVRDSLKELQK
ncbi:MAG: peroxiredoxin [Campylobacteraceae bacterium]